MNAPKLRFKEFNDEWDYKIFDELINIKSESYNPSLKKENYKCIELEHINQNTGTINGYCNSQDQKSNKNIFKKNEVLFGKLRPYLKKYWYATFDGVCSSEIWVGKSKNQNIVTNKFIYDLFQSHYFLQLCNLSTGSKMPRADWSFIKEQSIAIPNILEQKKISETLELLDKKIELQSKKIEALKLFKLYMENQFIFKDDASYTEYKLRDILIEGNKTPIADTSKYQKLTIKLNLKGLEFNKSQKEMSDKRPFYVRDENELIIGKQNYFNGSIAIVDKKYAGGICSNAIMSFKAKDGFDIKYIYLYLSQKSYMKQREFLANGTGQKELSEKEFLNFSIRIPSDNKVKKIIKNVNCISKKILLEENKLNKLIELKRGLMQNMFV